jgi:hypothetical protein
MVMPMPEMKGPPRDLMGRSHVEQAQLATWACGMENSISGGGCGTEFAAGRLLSWNQCGAAIELM